MKYRSKNQLKLFDFHDSVFSLVRFDGDELVVSVKHLNIHKNTIQNPSNYDMEIERAELTLKGVHSFSYEPGRGWKTGEDGQPYPIGPQIIYTGREAEEKIQEELQSSITVYDFDEKENGRYFIDALGIEPFFVMEFGFQDILIEWDAYRKKAWYELHRYYQYDLTLTTPDGEKTVPVSVWCHDEDVYRKGLLEKAPIINVGVKYGDEKIWGEGKDDTWADAFADLQKKLPEGMCLKCCLTCRHGNMCPEEPLSNELLCTKDVSITQKSDLYFYTQDKTERETRAKQYCFVCEDYKPQSDEYYTYSDYWESFKKV
ncbi:MAG: hypothetical protein IJD75_07475 [Clostridia bacterium]|nr:hypothetical protein [Clostridia bacterium]